jgi:ferric iron reductase protein FhuF
MLTCVHVSQTAPAGHVVLELHQAVPHDVLSQLSRCTRHPYTTAVNKQNPVLLHNSCCILFRLSFCRHCISWPSLPARHKYILGVCFGSSGLK